MKNFGKRLLCTAMAATVLAIGSSALAASEAVKAKVFFRPVYVEGREIEASDGQGNESFYFAYNGTIYIPLRLAGGWSGKTVTWDGASRTVSLSGSTEKDFGKEIVNFLPDELWDRVIDGESLPVTIEKDIKIVVDGQTRVFKNVNGETIYPLNYKNALYLPVRNIGELAGMTVNYKQTKTGVGTALFLRTAMTDEQIAAGDAYLKALWQCFSYNALKAQGKAMPILDERQRIDGQDDLFEFMSECNNANRDELRSFAEIGIEQMQKILDMPKPDCPVLEASFDELDERAQAGKEACEKVLAALDAGQDTKTCWAMMLNRNSAGGAQEGAASICGCVTIPLNTMNTVLYEK